MIEQTHNSRHTRIQTSTCNNTTMTMMCCLLLTQTKIMVLVSAKCRTITSVYTMTAIIKGSLTVGNMQADGPMPTSASLLTRMLKAILKACQMSIFIKSAKLIRV